MQDRTYIRVLPDGEKFRFEPNGTEFQKQQHRCGGTQSACDICRCNAGDAAERDERGSIDRKIAQNQIDDVHTKRHNDGNVLIIVAAEDRGNGIDDAHQEAGRDNDSKIDRCFLQSGALQIHQAQKRYAEKGQPEAQHEADEN